MDYSHSISDPNFANRQFQIIVPVFNEEEILEKVLNIAKESGYLKYSIFVDDASTDSSLKILQSWATEENFKVIHFPVNGKKEGAIRAAMEMLQKKGELLPYTILIDADSIIKRTESEAPIHTALEKAISYLNHNKLGALALRLEAVSDKPLNLFYRSAYADFQGMQFDNWLVSKQFQTWVINGSGGLFETQRLLGILQTMVPDFETGDLLITVELMKQKVPIAYYPLIKVCTYVPITLPTYFNQRRRWERGTIKILWYERKFYINNFRRPSLLAIYTLLHLALYFGLLVTPVWHYFKPLTLSAYTALLITVYIFWQIYNLIKGIFIRYIGINFSYYFFIKCVLIQGLMSMTVSMIARLTGFCEAIFFILKFPKKTNGSSRGIFK